ncbi:MAG: D-tyrosyl-tRNA(Tyr) deacylase [Clostridia bacterium]|nr:D-tyrosyl-tRNA(Tyr) deacylase [Clostridia bacterium]
MTAVLQRVKRATVWADGEWSGACEEGLLILLGVINGDEEEDARLLADKIARLRIFSDEAGKMNCSLADIDGSVLIISNFTLAANYSHGNRPDYMNAARPEVAEPLYEHFISLMEARVKAVGHGKFGADMQVDIQADGPVTIVMDSAVLRRGRGK